MNLGDSAISGASVRVLDVLECEQGFGARYAYPLLQDLAAPWRLHLPLLDPSGNWGSQHGDPAADARYTEVRLSEVGALALAAERGEVGPIPLGLVEGSLYRDGAVPPFAPDRVLEALTTGGADAGPPVLPTGGTVDGDIEALLAGRRARLTLGCTVVAEPGPAGPHRGPARRDDRPRRPAPGEPGRRPAERPRYASYLDGLDSGDGIPGGAEVPVLDVRDESSLFGIRLVCALAAGADPEDARRWVRSVWPVTVEVDCRLPAPMRRRLAAWDRGDGPRRADPGVVA